MNPLNLTAEDFKKYHDKFVKVDYLFDRKNDKHIEITGYLRDVMLGSTAPHLPANFDFQISQDSKQKLKAIKVPIPNNISIMHVKSIEIEK